MKNTAPRRVRNSFLVAIGLATVMLGAGCATPSLNQISAFGSAADSLATNARNGFELVDSSTIDRKMYDVAADTSLGPTDDTFTGVFKGPLQEKLQLRLRVLDKLGDYATALNALATADFRKDIDAASKDLYSSLSGLKKTYQDATGKELGLEEGGIQIIATAVDAIGNMIVEEKRREAIKKIIMTSDPAVSNAARLITMELGADSELAKFATQNLIDADGSVRQAYNTLRKEPGFQFGQRYEMLVRIRGMHEAATASPRFFDAVSKGAAQLAKTHTALKDAVDKNIFSSAGIASAVGELAEYAKSTKAFYKSLKPESEK